MASNPTKAIRELLLWARKEKIVLSSVTLQGVTITVEKDYNLVPPKGTLDLVERRQSMYEQFAGPLFQAATAPAGGATANEPTVEDEDD